MAQQPAQPKQQECEPRIVEAIEASVSKSIFGVAIGRLEVQPLWFATPTPEENLKKVLVPKVCHSELDQILNIGDVTASDIAAAWRAKALTCKDGVIVRQWAKLDYWFGGLLIALLSVYLLIFGGVFFWPNLSDATRLSAFLTCGAMTCLIAGSAIWVLKPQFTAKRAMRALGR